MENSPAFWDKSVCCYSRSTSYFVYFLCRFSSILKPSTSSSYFFSSSLASGMEDHTTSRCRFHQHFTCVFFYECVLRSFFLLSVGLCNFLAQEYWHKSCSQNVGEIDPRILQVEKQYFPTFFSSQHPYLAANKGIWLHSQLV